MPSPRAFPNPIEGKMPLSVRFPPADPETGLPPRRPRAPGRRGGRVVMPWVIEDRERV